MAISFNVHGSLLVDTDNVQEYKSVNFLGGDGEELMNLLIQ
jgi:hypothetical protein